jgi:hypothetical protein
MLVWKANVVSKPVWKAKGAHGQWESKCGDRAGVESKECGQVHPYKAATESKIMGWLVCFNGFQHRLAWMSHFPHRPEWLRDFPAICVRSFVRSLVMLFPIPSSPTQECP